MTSETLIMANACIPALHLGGILCIAGIDEADVMYGGAANLQIQKSQDCCMHLVRMG